MSEVPAAAIDRVDVAHYVDSLFIVYMILIFIRVLLSWIPRMPYYRWLNAVVEFVHQTTDPYLGFFRRFLPPIGGFLDISAILGIIVLIIARRVVVDLIAG